MTLEGGISGYLDRVKKLAGKDYPAYLEWSRQQQEQQQSKRKDSPSDMLTMLKALQSVNFKDSATLYINRDAIFNFQKFPLATSPNAQYLVVPDSTALQARKGDPAAPSPTSDVNPENLHPFFVRLYTKPGANPAKVPLPQFVLPLGRVVKQQNGFDEVDETNYVLVVDVTDPKGPIWLIYNRYPINQDVGARFDKPVDPKRRPQVFDVPNVDSIRIMDSLRSWAGRGSSAMKSAEIMDLAKAAGKEPVFVTWATKEDVARAGLPSPAIGG